MNTVSLAHTHNQEGWRRLDAGVIFLLTLTLWLSAPALPLDQTGSNYVALASNGAGGGCG